MRRRLANRGSVAAFLAALIFVVQVSLAAWGSAAMAGQPALDAFGNPLCITTDDGKGVLPPGEHGKVPSCCTLGCMAAATVLAGPDPVVTAFVAPPVSSLPVAHASDGPGLDRLDHHPASPRAPPLQA